MSLTTIDFDKYVIDKFDVVAGISKTTGELYFMFDEIKDGSLENGSEKVYGTSAHGARISALNTNKTAKFTCNNGFIVGGAVTTQIGGTAITASAENKIVTPNIEIVEVIDPTEITLEQIPVGTTGVEIPFIFKANKDMTQGDKFAISATASETAFALTPATKTITLPTGKFVKGDHVIVIYNYEASVGKKFTNSGNEYAKTCKLIIDVLCRDICDNETVIHTKFVFPNASVDGNFNIQVGNEPAVHAFSAEALQEVCSANKELWSWYVV